MTSIINKNCKKVHVNGTLSMINGEWFVNGKKVNLSEIADQQTGKEGEINLVINLDGGSIERLEVDDCNTITINGGCNRIHTHMGDVVVNGNVDGDVHTNLGTINCGNVGGDAHSNMGSVNYSKKDPSGIDYKSRYESIVKRVKSISNLITDINQFI